ncbi:MAG: DUF1570 domain-containing protein [Planctomycetota bacterium]|nr:DUF1570 domain-containing protein [Planctomycetota bacterium]
MTPFSASRAGWMLALALAGSPSALRAQEPPPTQLAPADATSFAAEFDQAQSFTRRRMWKSAHAAWLELLRKHAGAIYVRPRLPEIRELVRKCAFWQATREPDAKSCISGKLLAYDTTTGRIRIEYTLAQLGDFLKEDRVLVHPMNFVGPYTLELEGTAEELAEGNLFVGLEEELAYAVHFGRRKPGDTLFTLHEVVRIHKGMLEKLAQSEPTERESTRPTKVVISVGPRDLKVKYDGKQVLDADRDVGGFGRIALSDDMRFAELIVTGNVDPGWIDGLIDDRVQAERKAFDASWKLPAEFSAWPEAKPSETRKQTFDRLFGNLTVLENAPQKQAELVERVVQLRKEGASAQALEVLREVTDEQLPQAVRELMLTLCLIDLHRPGPALASLEARAKLVPPDPKFRYLQALLSMEVERHDEALTLLAGLESESFELPLILEEMAELLLLLGRPDEARAALERADGKVGPTTGLDELRTKLAKATVGPPWRRTHSHVSPHFAVDSDVDTPTAKVASKTLEEAWMDCQRLLGRVEPQAKPTRVFVFSGRASYLDYIEGISDNELANSAGIYSRSLRQLVAYNQLRGEDMLLVLRHECVHHYLDLALGAVPRWYDEGLAEYFAACRSADGTWTDGALHPERHATLLNKPALVETGVFVRLDDEQFMKNAESSYAQAWAFVHFLRYGRNEVALRFERRLWSELKERTDPASAVERALEGIDVKALNQAFGDHLIRLVLAR